MARKKVRPITEDDDEEAHNNGMGTCPQCGQETAQTIECPRCGKEGCVERCIPGGVGTICVECEENEDE